MVASEEGEGRHLALPGQESLSLYITSRHVNQLLTVADSIIPTDVIHQPTRSNVSTFPST